MESVLRKERDRVCSQVLQLQLCYCLPRWQNDLCGWIRPDSQGDCGLLGESVPASSRLSPWSAEDSLLGHSRKCDGKRARRNRVPSSWDDPLGLAHYCYSWDFLPGALADQVKLWGHFSFCFAGWRQGSSTLQGRGEQHLQTTRFPWGRDRSVVTTIASACHHICLKPPNSEI